MVIKKKKSAGKKNVLLNNRVKYAYHMYFYQSVGLFLHFLVFTCMNLQSIHLAENTVTVIALSSTNKQVFSIAATSFFSKMGFCLTFFVGSGRFLVIHHGENQNFYSKYWPTSVTVATRVPSVILYNSYVYHPFLTLLGN